METYLPMVGYFGLYEISNLGNVRAPAKIDMSGRPRKLRYLGKHKTEDGYVKAMLSINGISKLKTIHRLVYQTFVGPIPDGYEINHINGIRDDNRVENLNILTHLQNIEYSRDVLKPNYASYGSRKISDDQVRLVRELHKNRVSIKHICLHIGLKKSQILNIVSGKSWSHII
jgi:hypothetical protein